MNAVVYWVIAAFICVMVAGAIGRRVAYLAPDGSEKKGWALGLFIDDRQRFSLTHFQTVLWTLVFLSLLLGVFLARFFDGTPNDALAMKIPQEILTLAVELTGPELQYWADGVLSDVQLAERMRRQLYSGDVMATPTP